MEPLTGRESCSGLTMLHFHPVSTCKVRAVGDGDSLGMTLSAKMGRPSVEGIGKVRGPEDSGSSSSGSSTRGVHRFEMEAMRKSAFL